MKIAIIGAGNVGSTLGRKWSQTGHEISYGVPNSEDQKYLALKEYATVTTAKEAAEKSDLIVLATPWPATQNAIASLGNSIEGKILVDCTNPLKPDLSGLSIGHDSSGAEQIAQWAKGATVVKAFNSTGFNIMASPQINGTKTVMFVASDNQEARQTVVNLADEIGFDSIAFGELASARLLEPFALVWISLAYRYGLGRDFGFAIQRKNQSNVG